MQIHSGAPQDSWRIAQAWHRRLRADRIRTAAEPRTETAGSDTANLHLESHAGHGWCGLSCRADHSIAPAVRVSHLKSYLASGLSLQRNAESHG